MAGLPSGEGPFGPRRKMESASPENTARMVASALEKYSVKSVVLSTHDQLKADKEEEIRSQPLEFRTAFAAAFVLRPFYRLMRYKPTPAEYEQKMVELMTLAGQVTLESSDNLFIADNALAPAHNVADQEGLVRMVATVQERVRGWYAQEMEQLIQKDHDPGKGPTLESEWLFFEKTLAGSFRRFAAPAESS